MPVNYYTVLGIQPTATPGEIKTAFRRLALMYHPDRNTDVAAAERFNLVNRAYEVLRNKETRRRHDLQLDLNLPLNDEGQETIYIPDRIWMRISHRKVRVGERFSVIIRSFKRAQEPALAGLDQFEIVKHHSQIILIQDRPLREVLYVLRITMPGSYTIGPARMRVGRYEYISGSYDIQVVDEPLPKRVAASPMALGILTGCFILFLSINLAYYITKGRQKEKEEQRMVQLMKEAEKTGKMNSRYLPTGTSPYEKYLGKAVNDLAVNEQIRIKNSTTLDAVILVNDVATGKTERNYYIRAGDYLAIRYMPPGNYQLKAIFGLDWDTDEAADEGRRKGNFLLMREVYLYTGKAQQIIINSGNTVAGSEGDIYDFELLPAGGANVKMVTADQKDSPPVWPH